jgi:hypothetical protein
MQGKIALGRTSKIALQLNNLFADLLLLLLLQVEGKPRHTHQHAASSHQAARSFGSMAPPATSISA